MVMDNLVEMRELMRHNIRILETQLQHHPLDVNALDMLTRMKATPYVQYKKCITFAEGLEFLNSNIRKSNCRKLSSNKSLLKLIN